MCAASSHDFGDGFSLETMAGKITKPLLKLKRRVAQDIDTFDNKNQWEEMNLILSDASTKSLGMPIVLILSSQYFRVFRVVHMLIAV